MSRVNVVDFLKKGSLFIHCTYPTTPTVYEIIKVKDNIVTVDWKTNVLKPIKYSIGDATLFVIEGLWVPIDDRTKYDI